MSGSSLFLPKAQPNVPHILHVCHFGLLDSNKNEKYKHSNGLNGIQQADGIFTNHRNIKSISDLTMKSGTLLPEAQRIFFCLNKS